MQIIFATRGRSKLKLTRKYSLPVNFIMTDQITTKDYFNFNRPGKNNWRRKPECFGLCFEITSTELFPTPVWFYKSPQGVRNKSATNFHHQFLNNIYVTGGGIKLPRRVDFLLTNFSKPRQRFFDSVVCSNLLLVECKTTRFGLLHPTQNSNCSS